MTFKEYIIKKQLLNEGGAAGHLSHVIDNSDFTFKELFELFDSLFNGNIKLTEKLDGINISVTWKDGSLKLARNKTTILNPLSIEETARKFEGRGYIKDTFVNSMQELENAFETADENKLLKWFNNGLSYLSCEVISAQTKNVIDYNDTYLIVLHNIMTFDSEGNKKGTSSEYIQEIYNTIGNSLSKGVYKITPPQVLSINDSLNAQKALNNFDSELNDFLKKFNLRKSDTVKTYIDNSIRNLIDNEFQDNITEEIKEILFNRYANSIKNPNLANILKLAKSNNDLNYTEFQNTLRHLENSIQDKFNDIKFPLEMIISKFAVEFLKCLKGFIAVNPDRNIKSMTDDLDNAIAALKQNPKHIDTLNKQLKKIQTLGIDNIVPTEGVVFEYKGKLYKLTGLFAPINQILGLIKFS